MAISKVILDGETLLDVTNSTVNPSRILSGYTAKGADGTDVTGTYEPPSSVARAVPSVSVNSGTGLVTATSTQLAGAVTAGTETGTLQLTTQATKTVTPTESEQTAVASGRYTTGAVKVGAISPTYVGSGITQRHDTDIIGIYDDGVYSVNVPEGYYRYFSYVTVPNGTEGTPTATKGNVSNHTISITPSVTNMAGYITGGTKTGAAVSVAASELVSGTLPITQNGTVDVANYASVNVSVSGGGGTDNSDLKDLIERTVTTIDLPSDLTVIGNYAFYECSELIITEIPSGVTEIGTSAFADCYNLTVTELPSSVRKINSSAFIRCNGITSITCNGAISTLGTSSFLGNSSHSMQLASVSFPNMALTGSIGTVFGSTTAANACQQLESADIGKTAGIAANAFANCYKLQTLVLRRDSAICTLANVNAFTNTPMRGYNGLAGTVYVPSALISTYKTATNWSTLYNDGTLSFAAIEGSEWEA